MRRGDPTVQGTLIELRRSEFPSVQLKLYELITGVGDRSLILIARPGVEDMNPDIALAASKASIACASQEYHDRLLLVEVDF